MCGRQTHSSPALWLMYVICFFSLSTYGCAQMAGIGLRPLLDHHPLQFDITVHGQNRVVKFQVLPFASYSCTPPPPPPPPPIMTLSCISHTNCLVSMQSASKEARDLWVSEIRRLLELQFTLIKGECLCVYMFVHVWLCVCVCVCVCACVVVCV